MKLQKMTDFVLNIKTIYPREIGQDFDSYTLMRLIYIEKYAEFLKQPLTLGIFVPCGEDGHVLIEPTESNPIYWSEEYKKAKERVLFKDFEIVSAKFGFNLYLCHKQCNISIMNKSDGFEWISNEDYKNVEELCLNQPNIELTESALKQIGIDE